MNDKFSIKFYNFTKTCSLVLCKTMFKYEVVGKNNIPEGGVIFAGNHISLYDPVLIGITTDRPVRFIGKEELFKYKISNYVFSKLGGIPVNRDNPGLSVIKTSIKVLNNDENLCIFPEGTRNKSDKLLPFKRGAEVISKKSKRPIVPFSITGSYSFKEGIKLEYGEAIYLDNLDIKNVGQSDYVMDSVKKLVLKNRR